MRTRTFDSSLYSTTQATHIDMYMYTHIHTHACKHPTIHYQAPMKHTCKNICALALLTHPSTLPSKGHIEICTCIHTYTHTHASIHPSIMKHLWNTHVKTSAHSHFRFILLLYHTSDTYRYAHVYTHTHTRAQASNHLSWSTYETHMRTCVHSHCWLILHI